MFSPWLLLLAALACSSTQATAQGSVGLGGLFGPPSVAVPAWLAQNCRQESLQDILTCVVKQDVALVVSAGATAHTLQSRRTVIATQAAAALDGSLAPPPINASSSPAPPYLDLTKGALPIVGDGSLALLGISIKGVAQRSTVDASNFIRSLAAMSMYGNGSLELQDVIVQFSTCDALLLYQAYACWHLCQACR